MAGLLQAVNGNVGSSVSLIREDGQAEPCELVAPGGPGGTIDPIQNTLWLDPAAAPATPNGSIASPFQTFAACIAVVAAAAAGEWEIALPAATLALGNQATPLVGVQTLLLSGIDRTATDIGNFAPNETDDPTPRYFYRNLKAGTLHYRVATIWGRSTLENCEVATLQLEPGPTWGGFILDNCTVTAVVAGSVNADLTFRNCILGSVATAGACVFENCTFLAASTLDCENTASFFSCTFGAGVQVISPVSMDRESEVSLLENGGALSLVTSLDGWGQAQNVRDSASPDIDFSGGPLSRWYLAAHTLTGPTTTTVQTTGTTADGQILIVESYNQTAFSKTLDFGSGTFVLAPNVRVRVVFRYDGVADAVKVLSWQLL